MLLVKTQRETLLGPLQAVSGIVERRHTLPILSNVLLEKRGDLLTWLATDIEIQITASSHGVVGDGDGALTVGARKLQEILRSLPDAAEITLALDDRRLQIKAGRSRFSLQTLPAEDFPNMATAEGQALRLTVSQKQFRNLLGQTQYAMAAQDVRYYLNGLLLLIEGDELRAVATDGHRLAYSSMALEHAAEAAGEPANTRRDLILPRKTVLELNRLLADNDEPLLIDVLPSQIRFQFAHISLISKLIDGRFPDYERVIPGSLKNVISVNRSLLLQ